MILTPVCANSRADGGGSAAGCAALRAFSGDDTDAQHLSSAHAAPFAPLESAASVPTGKPKSRRASIVLNQTNALMQEMSQISVSSAQLMANLEELLRSTASLNATAVSALPTVLGAAGDEDGEEEGPDKAPRQHRPPQAGRSASMLRRSSALAAPPALRTGASFRRASVVNIGGDGSDAAAAPGAEGGALGRSRSLATGSSGRKYLDAAAAAAVAAAGNTPALPRRSRSMARRGSLGCTPADIADFKALRQAAAAVAVEASHRQRVADAQSCPQLDLTARKSAASGRSSTVSAGYLAALAEERVDQSMPYSNTPIMALKPTIADEEENDAGDSTQNSSLWHNESLMLTNQSGIMVQADEEAVQQQQAGRQQQRLCAGSGDSRRAPGWARPQINDGVASYEIGAAAGGNCGDDDGEPAVPEACWSKTAERKHVPMARNNSSTRRHTLSHVHLEGSSAPQSPAAADQQQQRRAPTRRSSLGKLLEKTCHTAAAHPASMGNSRRSSVETIGAPFPGSAEHVAVEGSSASSSMAKDADAAINSRPPAAAAAAAANKSSDSAAAGSLATAAKSVGKLFKKLFGQKETSTAEPSSSAAKDGTASATPSSTRAASAVMMGPDKQPWTHDGSTPHNPSVFAAAAQAAPAPRPTGYSLEEPGSNSSRKLGRSGSVTVKGTVERAAATIGMLRSFRSGQQAASDAFEEHRQLQQQASGKPPLSQRSLGATRSFSHGQRALSGNNPLGGAVVCRRTSSMRQPRDGQVAPLAVAVHVQPYEHATGDAVPGQVGTFEGRYGQQQQQQQQQAWGDDTRTLGSMPPAARATVISSPQVMLPTRLSLDAQRPAGSDAAAATAVVSTGVAGGAAGKVLHASSMRKRATITEGFGAEVFGINQHRVTFV